MRKLFWILLLANVAVFAGIQQGWFARNGQAVVQSPPLHEEMIRLQEPSQAVPAKTLPPSGTPAAASAAPAATPVPAPVQHPAPAPAPSSPDLQLTTTMAEPVITNPGAPVCLEWGDFSGTDLARATAALAALQLGEKLSHHQIERDIGYWVYIPPLKNKAAVNKKIEELRELGVREYFVVNEGRWRKAISMGVFKTRDAAQNLLDHLRASGVHSAKIGERASKLITTVFRLDGTDAATGARLAAIQKDFPGSELKSVSCTHAAGAH